MPQGAAKKTSNINQKKNLNKKARINQRPKKGKKHKDPITAAIHRKIEGVVMQKAMKNPLNGGIRVVKPTEEKVKVASVSTKSLVKNPTQKIK